MITRNFIYKDQPTIPFIYQFNFDTIPKLIVGIDALNLNLDLKNLQVSNGHNISITPLNLNIDLKNPNVILPEDLIVNIDPLNLNLNLLNPRINPNITLNIDPLNLDIGLKLPNAQVLADIIVNINKLSLDLDLKGVDIQLIGNRIVEIGNLNLDFNLLDPEILIKYNEYDFISNLTPTDFSKLNTNYNNEQNLYSTMASEAFNQYGISITYFPVDFNLNKDPIFQEDVDTKILKSFQMQAKPEDIENSDESILTNFGIEEPFNLKLYITKKHFSEIVNNLYVPRVNDVIKNSVNGKYYQITSVNEETNQFHLRKNNFWELSMKKLIKNSGLDVNGFDSNLGSVVSGDDIFDRDNGINNNKDDFIL